jgi:hypothetical protein
VTLCYECHMKAHGRTGKGLNHSRLTKEGLARSTKALGAHNPIIKKALLRGRENERKKTNERIFPHITQAIENGYESLNKISNYLNKKGITTPRGKTWTKAGLSRIMRRYREEMLKEET